MKGLSGQSVVSQVKNVFLTTAVRVRFDECRNKEKKKEI